MLCVGCGCSDAKRCTAAEGGPCRWAKTKFPYCTVCLARAAEQLVVGARVRIRAGEFRGQLGVIVALDPAQPDLRFVRRELGDPYHAAGLSLVKA